MPDIENPIRDHQQDFLFSVALCLIVAVVLVLIGAVFRSGSEPFSGLSARDQIEVISESGAGFYTAALLLGAVAALFFLPAERLERSRPLVIVTLIVGTVIALLATYSVVDIITVHIPSGNSAEVLTFGMSQGSLGSRLGGVLPQAGSLFIAVVALVGASRLGNSPGASGSREIEDRRPG